MDRHLHRHLGHGQPPGHLRIARRAPGTGQVDLDLPEVLPPAGALVLGGCSSASGPGCDTEEECPDIKRITLDGYKVPIYEVVQEPIYEEREVQIWGMKTVPVYQERRRPVTITLTDFSGCENVIDLWDKTDERQVGVRRVRACIGTRVERVQVGCCPKRVIVGWRTVNDTGCPPSP